MKRRPSGQDRLRIAAPAERVWALLADVTRMPEWSPELVCSEWLDGATTAAPGARFAGHSRVGAYRWSRTCEILTASAPNELAFATLDRGEQQTVWRYTIVPDGDGVLVSESFEVVGRMPVVARVMWGTHTGRAIRSRQVHRGMRRTLERIKQAAEAPS